MKEFSKIAILLRELTTENITIITTNLLIGSKNQAECNDDEKSDEEILEENDIDEFEAVERPEYLTSACGKFWESVPSIRISITDINDDTNFHS